MDNNKQLQSKIKDVEWKQLFLAIEIMKNLLNFFKNEAERLDIDFSESIKTIDNTIHTLSNDATHKKMTDDSERNN